MKQTDGASHDVLAHLLDRGPEALHLVSRSSFVAAGCSATNVHWVIYTAMLCKSSNASLEGRHELLILSFLREQALQAQGAEIESLEVGACQLEQEVEAIELMQVVVRHFALSS